MQAMLIADDLTGACDAGAQFAGRGPVPVFVAPSSPGSEWTIAVVDTESRSLSPEDASDRIRAAVTRLGGRLATGLLFKKIDSTLRGPVTAELEALLDASGRRAALVCPAFPGQHRTVVDGMLLVKGAPVHESPIGKDPAFPGGTSDVVEIVGRRANRPVRRVALARVRGDHGNLARALCDARDEILVADASTDDDLDRLAESTRSARELVLVGSAGLARAVAAAHGQAAASARVPDGRAWLIVAGSLHPATQAQIDRIEQAGVRGVRLTDDRDPDVGPLVEQIKAGHPAFITTSDATVTTVGAQRAIAMRLAGLAANVLARSLPDLLVVTGGDTAIEVLRAVGANRIELCGAPSIGLGLGVAVVDSTAGFPLLTKAGGFGAPDLLLWLLGSTT
jgi:D-threonate/D-erythronate kinase